MSKAILRIALAGAILLGLCGTYHPASVQAVGGACAYFASVPPNLDGTASASEWGNACLAYSDANVKVYFESDNQFLYFLVDAINATSLNPLSNGDDAAVYLDTNSDGTYDYGYYPGYTSPNPLLRTTNMGVGWSAGAPGFSYGAVGFGSSLSSATPHRIYEMALRLSELNMMPGQNLYAYVYLGSTTPAIVDTTLRFSLT